MSTTKIMAFFFLIAAIAIAGCSSGQQTTSTTLPELQTSTTLAQTATTLAVTATTLAQQPNTADVFNATILQYTFTPNEIDINVGQTVTWTNLDSVRHSIVSDAGGELSSPLLAKGESYSHTFAKRGIYTYHCSSHRIMSATVVVS